MLFGCVEAGRAAINNGGHGHKARLGCFVAVYLTAKIQKRWHLRVITRFFVTSKPFLSFFEWLGGAIFELRRKNRALYGALFL